MDQLLTARLRMRAWVPADEAPMAAINSDPEVTRHLNREVDRAAVAVFYPGGVTHWDTHGFGWWAVEGLVGELEGRFLGFVGIAYPTFLAEIAERPELGWRLAREAWGRGLATEAAIAAGADGFERLGLRELVSIIHPDNVRSQAVARKLGMHVDRHVFNPVLGREVEVWC